MRSSWCGSPRQRRSFALSRRSMTEASPWTGYLRAATCSTSRPRIRSSGGPSPPNSRSIPACSSMSRPPTRPGSTSSCPIMVARSRGPLRGATMASPSWAPVSASERSSTPASSGPRAVPTARTWCAVSRPAATRCACRPQGSSPSSSRSVYPAGR